MTLNRSDGHAVKAELDGLVVTFFQALSFCVGSSAQHEEIHRLFIEPGLLIKNTGTSPEISTVDQFIEYRRAMVRSGELTRFLGVELFETTRIFGHIAHRFSGCAKRGALNGEAFEMRGMVSTQFILTSSGWRISSMAWDDERPGQALVPLYDA